jgi:DNA repair protein RadA/Sms
VKAAKSAFRCSECGYVSPQWMGRCPECSAWNSLIEETVIDVKAPALRPRQAGSSFPQSITDVDLTDTPRFSAGYAELDRVLGGGVVPGSLVLIGGEPGIGKSTLLLQVAQHLAGRGDRVLIASGEESARQIRLRADRLGPTAGNLLVMSETDIGRVIEEAVALAPRVLVVDSIQTMSSADSSGAAGSVGQVKECTQRLMALAKEGTMAVFIVGHVTKEGAIAGPRVLEHMVDTVLYFEGERLQSHRIVRAVKNRFGSTDEIGVFEMGDAGLREVANPSEMFLSDRRADTPGSVVVASIEGTRSFLVELQALAAPTSLAYPRRVAAGLDYQRIALLTAVLERRAGLKLGSQDIYVSAAGGLKVIEPAADLGIALAVASAYSDKPAPADTVVFGELGLGGEIRFVSQTERRLKEASRLGFKRAIAPVGSAKTRISGLVVTEVGTIKEAIALLGARRPAR